jgi:single-strand DNA-binding protein
MFSHGCRATPIIYGVTIIKTLGQDPELRFTPQGNPVCTLSVATGESYTENQSRAQEAEKSLRVIGWDKLTANCFEMLGQASLIED